MERQETEDCIAKALTMGSQGRFDEAAAAIDDPCRNLPGAEACSACLKAVRELSSGEHEEGIQAILPALHELEELGYSISLGWAYAAAGFSFGILGDPALGIDWIEKALVIAERSGDGVQLRRCHNDKASLLAMMDDYDRATEFYERALAIDPLTLSDLERGGILNNLAYSNIQNARRGDIPHRESIALARKALGHADAALTLIPEAGNARVRGWVHYNRGSALTMLGDYAAALADLELALDSSIGLSNLRMEVLISLGRLQCDAGQAADARRSLDEALRMSEAGRYSIFTDSVLAALLRLAALHGSPEEVMRWSELRIRNVNTRYRRHLRLMERNAEVIIELERARMEAAEAHRRSRYWKDEALVDPLTRCLNRRGFSALASTSAEKGQARAVVMLDLDHFKEVNDSFGHEIGDRVLMEIGGILRGQFREGDAVARYGGEEFIAFVGSAKSRELAGLCERVRLAIGGHDWERLAPGLMVTASVGAAIDGESTAADSSPLETLISLADKALYRAKSRGRNRVVLHGSD